MCGIYLNRGITPFNIITYWLGYWGMLTAMAVIFSFSTFILADKRYYNIPVKDLGGILGTVGTIDEFFVFC